MSPTPDPKSQSTGPRTPEGKHRASLNALRHGLTGRVVVLPSEDLAAYQAFCKDLMEDLAPEGPLETQFAQTFCDTQWRLNRIRAIEESMFALGHFEPAGAIDPGHPEIHAALTNARVFRENSNVFANLSLYEQRLNRALKESLRQLQELQAQRRAAREAAANENKNKAEPEGPAPEPAPGGFVFSNPEIETKARHGSRPATVQTGQPEAPNPLQQAA